MSTDRRIRDKIPEFLDKDHKSLGIGTRDSGPFIAIVKHNADPLRTGRLQVFIPEFGGVEDIASHWITVGYASPYAGAARRLSDKNDKMPGNDYDKVNHSYGMWFTPPDIGNHVLVTFIAGNTNNGYWFACIQPDISHYATPGIAGSEFLETPRDPELAEALKKGPYPCVEFNEENKELRKNWTNFLEIPKPIHEHQARVLLKQGLEDDKIRGVISSSSQRESPSRVFGISTPGLDYPARTTSGAVAYRKGGHTFVMDDGDPAKDNVDKLIRLRTSGGHQLLMNDSEEIIYIGNANGKTWMEFTQDGKIHMFSDSDFTLHAKSDINMHADNSINMFAGNDIKMFAGTSIQEQSKLISLKAIDELKEYGGKINVKSASLWNVVAGSAGTIGTGTELVFASGMIYLNTKPATSVVTQNDIPVVLHPEPALKGIKWVHEGKKFSSTIPLTAPLPTHEPYIDHKSIISKRQFVRTGVASTTGAVTSAPSKLADTSSPQPGPLSLTGDGVKNKASAGDLARHPISNIALGILTIEDMTALKAQIGRSESNLDYSKQNSYGYIGKYQFGVQALETHQYIKSGTWALYKKNSAVNDPANWVGKNGITSKEAFFAATELQETLMDQNLQMNYRDLIRTETITSASTKDDVAGKLAVAHLLGSAGCFNWCFNTGKTPSKDGYGTTGGSYYNAGRYAIASLSPQVKPPTETV